MKRIMLALLVGGMVFGGVFAMAAALDVDGGTIQAGSDVELRCDANGVNVDGWALESDTGLVNGVRILNIDAACSGDDMFVKITHDGTIIAEGKVQPIPNDGDATDKDPDVGEVGVQISFSPQDAGYINDITVYIEGP